MKKTFLEVFHKYHPDTYTQNILLSITDMRVMADKELKIIEVAAQFPQLVDKNELYRIQEEICKAYDLNRVKIYPKYPQELFSADYVPQLLQETEEVGIVARGFFHRYKYKLDQGVLTVELPVIDAGILLMEDARTPQIMENILMSEFGLNIRVKIVHSEDFHESERSELYLRELEELDKRIAKAAKEYDRAKAEGGFSSRSAEPQGIEQPEHPRIRSVYDEDPTPIIVDGICKIGHTSYDISAPEYVIGDAFEIKPTPIAALDKPVRNVVILGEIFAFNKERNRTGEKFNLNYCITDGNSSIEIKSFNVEPEESDEICKVISNGAVVALKGYAKYETKKSKDGNRTEGPDCLFYPVEFAKIKKLARKDNAPVKRVELHLHTQMSTMDAMIPPSVAVKQANKWGHPAVALTDHGNVQAYQDAMLTAEKIGQKVIYGMEAYFVNDTAGAVTGHCAYTPYDECIVFDIETTGLSAKTCKITEIGAVRICQGEVLDTFNTFVDPEVPIPDEIVTLTGITDDMVKGAPKTKEALEAFFAFIGDVPGQPHKLLIAHNASFDIGFIRHYAKENGMELRNPYLDTVALSRFLNPSLNKHKLNLLAEHYGLGDFNHHRASDDAEMLAYIYFKMCEQMKTAEILTFDQLCHEMTVSSDPLKLKPYHQILLVKNPTGLKNLYKLVSMSNLQYYRRSPRIPKTQLEKFREGLIVGSACEAGEIFTAILENKSEAELEELVNFYDYLEIQPITNNMFLIDEGKVADEEGLRDLNRRIVALGEQYNKPVVATCDAHFLNKEDGIYRKILLCGQKFKDGDRDIFLYYRTTEEMLEEFSYLGEEKAYEVVVTNTNMINDMIESNIRPFPKGTFTPTMDGAEEDLQRICWERAKKMYGDPLPEIVSARLARELDSIIKNGFAVLYMIAQKLVWYSEQQGYLVGSRGSVGSSVVASMAGISEVNPLPAHYWCPNCQYSDFEYAKKHKIGSGFDLPDANCPKCGTKLNYDGHDIPFETFLGFYGDKSPDIDLNFSGEVQGRVHKYTEELFGAENVFRAGTIGTLADKTAYGYVMKYFEEKGQSVSNAEANRLVANCVGVKRNTGQHPGGIVVVPKTMEVYDFCPVQHPAEDVKSDIVTTHFTFEYLHDTLLKLDELGHDMPTKYKYLEKYSDTSVLDVPMNDRSIYELFLSTKPLGISPEDINCPLGTLGLPELGTKFVIKMLQECKPQTFSDLLQISGLSHGTDVWTNNAQELIKNGTCTISEVIGTRDSIMLALIDYGVQKDHAFKIMEMVRKGKGLTPEYEQEMLEAGVPDWYIWSCKRIKYMFPKAHAAAYDMSAIRLGWYKVHIPLAFYCAMFTVQSDGFDGELIMKGKKALMAHIKDIEDRGFDASPKEQASIPVLQLANEAFARGIRFLPVDLEKSDWREFLPENGKIRLPFSSLGGLGETAAENIVRARAEEPFFSVEDLKIRAKLSQAVIDILRRNGVLDNVNETDQLTFNF